MAKGENRVQAVPSSGKILTLLLLALFGLIPFMVARIGAQQKTAQVPTQEAPHSVRVYLPPGENDASLMPVILARLGEPSLLEAAKDVKTFSFRVSFFSLVPTHEAAVRIVVSDDGSGEITSAVSSGKDTVVKRTKNSVTSADVERLLELIRKGDFWSTASIEQMPNAPNKNGHEAYVLDGAWWMIEGVHDRSFHYVFRRNPNPSPITEIGCYLARDLAKPAEGTIPMAGCASPARQSR